MTEFEEGKYRRFSLVIGFHTLGSPIGDDNRVKLQHPEEIARAAAGQNHLGVDSISSLAAERRAVLDLAGHRQGLPI